MSRDARIRLEGKLEVLEGAVATLRAAVVRARRGEFRALGEAMDLDVGEQVFELADVKGLQIQRLMVRSTRPWRLTATLNGGEQVQVRLPYVPEGFAAALLRARPRLPISRTGWAWAWF